MLPTQACRRRKQSHLHHDEGVVLGVHGLEDLVKVLRDEPTPLVIRDRVVVYAIHLLPHAQLLLLLLRYIFLCGLPCANNKCPHGSVACIARVRK